jgi:hypothetical protein
MKLDLRVESLKRFTWRSTFAPKWCEKILAGISKAAVRG